MRLGLFILLFLVSFWSIGQGLEPSQIQGAPKLNDILQAKNMYIDEYGDTLYIYQHTSISGLRTDSIYLRNDTIYLRDGSGFVKIPTSSITAGQTVTVQTLISGDTIYAEVNNNSLDSTHIKTGSIARNDLSFAIDDSKWTQSGIALFPKTLNSQIGINTNIPNTWLFNNISGLAINGRLGITNGAQHWLHYMAGSNYNIWNPVHGDVFRLNYTSGKWQGPVYSGSGNRNAFFNSSGQLEASIYDGVAGVGVAGYVGRWFDENTLSIGGLYFPGEGSMQAGLGTTAPNSYLLDGGAQGIAIHGTNPRFSISKSTRNWLWYMSGNHLRLWNSNNGEFMHYGDNNRLGINNTNPQASLDVTGDVRISNRTGSAIIGAGFTADGKIVQYDLDTAIMIPETAITSGTNISITGNGSNATPYVINNTFSQTFQTIGSNGDAGNITLSNGGGTLNLNVNDADANPNNEISLLGVTSGLLMNYTQGFANGNGVNLTITGATKSASPSVNGGSITWTLPDDSPNNEIQSLSFGDKVSGVVPLNILNGVGVNFAEGQAINIFRDGSNQIILSVPNGSVTPSLLDRSYLTSFTEVDGNPSNEGSLSVSIGAINTSIINSNTTGSNGVTIAVNNGLSISEVGNVITISNTGVITESDPTVGSHIKSITTTDISNWNNDLVGPTYSQGSGISISGNVITNTGDLSNTNEGVMSLTTNTASTNYTFTSNSSGTTPLILNASTGITMPRSSNQISFALTNTGVTAASYTNANITVDGQGRITSASNGSSGADNQTLSWNSANNQLSISNGNTQTLTSFGASTTFGNNLTMTNGLLEVGRSSSLIAKFYSNFNGSTIFSSFEQDGSGNALLLRNGAADVTTKISSNSNSYFQNNISFGSNLTPTRNADFFGTARFRGQFFDWVDNSGSTSSYLGANISGQLEWKTLPNHIQFLGTGTNLITLSSGGGSVGLKTVNGQSILGSGDISISSTNIYNINGSIPSSTTRVVTIPSSSSLELGSFSNAYLDLSNETAEAQFGYGTGGSLGMYSSGFILETSSTNNTGILSLGSGIQLNTSHNNDGTNGQVLTSNGTYAQWQTPSPSFDGVFVSSTNYASVGSGSSLPLFGGSTTTAGGTTVSGNGFIKGVSGGVYEVDVIVNVTTADAEGFVTLGIRNNGGSPIHTVKLYNHKNGEVTGDVIYTFYTNTSSGTWTVTNESGATRDFDIKRVSIKRVM